MAIVEGLLTFAALGGFCFAFACVGSLALRWLWPDLDDVREHLLLSVGLGLLSTEVVLFWIGFAGYIQHGAVFIVGGLCLPLLLEGTSVTRRLRSLCGSVPAGTTSTRALLLAVGVILGIEFTASLAPLTGSDAMQYHFTAQKLILAEGFHPFFSYSHSFLCAQHHLLILLGLALGSEKLALGFIFLGGVLTAGALCCLAKHWASKKVALGVTLLFLLTPLVFWQISASGSPDIFMAFFVVLAVIVLRRNPAAGTWRQALLAGLLTGGIAGAKYTGCIIAAALLVAVIVEFRSAAMAAVFVLGSFAAGIWPYLRNMLWSGDPIFPFLAETLSPQLASRYALKALAEDTGAAANHRLPQFLPYIFFAGLWAKSPGFWDFYGPVIFALAPLTLFAFRNCREWRVPILVWVLAAAGIFLSSGLPRLLLPLFPIGLACTAAGIDRLAPMNWKIARAFALSSVTFMIFLGAAGLAVYSWKPIQAAIGLTPREAYLENRAQDYQISEAINQALEGVANPKKVLVFTRHQYYLRVPCVNGDPASSLEVAPERLRTAGQWNEFFGKHGIGFVARAPDYPMPIAMSLLQLERSGALSLFAEKKVENLKGMRVNGVRAPVDVLILKVNR